MRRAIDDLLDEAVFREMVGEPDVAIVFDRMAMTRHVIVGAAGRGYRFRISAVDWQRLSAVDDVIAYPVVTMIVTRCQHIAHRLRAVARGGYD